MGKAFAENSPLNGFKSLKGVLGFSNQEKGVLKPQNTRLNNCHYWHFSLFLFFALTPICVCLLQ